MARLNHLVAWRNQGRAIHAELTELFGVGFPETNLLSVVDSLLKVGSEGQAKAWRKPRKSPRAKRGTLTSVVVKSLTAKPQVNHEVWSRAKKSVPGLTANKVAKTLAALHSKKLVKREGDRGLYKYYLSA